ncbi:glycoside hydrolase family 2 protein [Chitinophaga pinensis]|uniref:glycoside hydrolase family 2 protein n=1 Tax=Chitinophaga pinensis TaxID=79329 RepID=UPI001C992ED2|nr:glycoside hydrolase family 2 protein [Chitinophaga pinensis]
MPLFGIRLLLTGAADGKQILPAIFSDNYFSLMNGETKTVTIEFDSNAVGKDGLNLRQNRLTTYRT